MDIQRLRERLEPFGEVLVCEETIDFKAIQIVMDNVEEASLDQIETIVDEEVLATYPTKDLFRLEGQMLKIRYKK